MKLTLAHFKAFITRNAGRLEIASLSNFNGMTDGVERCADQGFLPAEDNGQPCSRNTLGIAGVWLVGQSRDYFSLYSDSERVGFHVYNSCGSFNLAVRRGLDPKVDAWVKADVGLRQENRP